MARPLKTNADYFTHDNDMRNDVKVKALRRKFGHEGYSLWCMLLETLTDSSDFKYEYTDLNIELLSADFDIDSDRLREIIDYLLLLKLLQTEDNYLYSSKLIERFASLIRKRKQDRNQEEDDISELSGSETPQNGVIGSENPYSRVEKSKEDIIEGGSEILNSTCAEQQGLTPKQPSSSSPSLVPPAPPSPPNGKKKTIEEISREYYRNQYTNGTERQKYHIKRFFNLIKDCGMVQVLQFKKPISAVALEKYAEKYGWDLIESKLKAIENKAGVTKTNIDLSLTLNNWMEREHKLSPKSAPMAPVKVNLD